MNVLEIIGVSLITFFMFVGFYIATFGTFLGIENPYYIYFSAK